MQNDPILASFDTTLSPHRRITAPSLLLAFAYIHGEVGTPTGGIYSALVGQNGPVLCAEREGAEPFSRIIETTPFSLLTWFVEYRLLLRGWCAGLRPPTICAKSSKAYNEKHATTRLGYRMACYRRPAPVLSRLPYTTTKIITSYN